MTTRYTLRRSKAADQIAQRTGRRPHPDSVRRWALDGVRLASGEVLRLPALTLGRQLYFDPADVDAFADRLGGAK